MERITVFVLFLAMGALLGCDTPPSDPSGKNSPNMDFIKEAPFYTSDGSSDFDQGKISILNKYFKWENTVINDSQIVSEVKTSGLPNTPDTTRKDTLNYDIYDHNNISCLIMEDNIESGLGVNADVKTFFADTSASRFPELSTPKLEVKGCTIGDTIPERFGTGEAASYRDHVKIYENKNVKIEAFKSIIKTIELKNIGKDSLPVLKKRMTNKFSEQPLKSKDERGDSPAFVWKKNGVVVNIEKEANAPQYKLIYNDIVRSGAIKYRSTGKEISG